MVAAKVESLRLVLIHDNTLTDTERQKAEEAVCNQPRTIDVIGMQVMQRQLYSWLF